MKTCYIAALYITVNIYWPMYKTDGGIIFFSFCACLLLKTDRGEKGVLHKKFCKNIQTKKKNAYICKYFILLLCAVYRLRRIPPSG